MVTGGIKILLSKAAFFALLLFPNAVTAQTREPDACLQFIHRIFKTGREQGGVDSTDIVRLRNFNTAREGVLVPFNLHPTHREAVHHSRFSGWRFVAGDSLEISWRNGFYGPLIKGQMSRDTLTGYARHTTDDGPEPPPEAIRAVRVTCPSDTKPNSR